MVFSSPVFLFLFLPLVLLWVGASGSIRAKNTALLTASLLFYAWGEGIYLLVMLAVILFNHVAGLAIRRAGSPKAVLALAVVTNLSTLIWFKYANLLADTISPFLERMGLPPLMLGPVHLPIGISFFIFHSLSYVVDVYRGTAEAQRRPGISALYISLFPQLVAGPIIRYHDVAEQFTARTVGITRFASGVRRFIIGLAKKVLIADQCARIADPVFELGTEAITTPLAWLAVVAYAVQIYFDFSGYSDMAIGLGRLFGFEFLENFNRPYIARSIREFWKRWHISLTNFFRDYLYIPLGGNREGPVRTYVNLLIVFFLTGLWHGASWNFVVWGMIHGVMMMAERAGLGKWLDRAPRPLGNIYMLCVVLTAWMFFRVEDITSAWRYVVALWGGSAGSTELYYPSLYLTNATGLALAIGILGSLNAHVALARVLRIPRLRIDEAAPGVWGHFQVAGILLLFIGSAMSIASSTYSPFIYFRF
jgi:alginate O-acetyltransferase complex protein AlgI